MLRIRDRYLTAIRYFYPLVGSKSIMLDKEKKKKKPSSSKKKSQMIKIEETDEEQENPSNVNNFSQIEDTFSSPSTGLETPATVVPLPEKNSLIINSVVQSESYSPRTKSLKRSHSVSHLEIEKQLKRQKVSEGHKHFSSQEATKVFHPLLHLSDDQFSNLTKKLSIIQESSNLEINQSTTQTEEEEEEEDEEIFSLSQKYQTSAKRLDEKKEITTKELEILKNHVLGRGTFSTVYKGILQEENVAVKIFHPNLKDIDIKRLIRNEAIVLK